MLRHKVLCGWPFPGTSESQWGAFFQVKLSLWSARTTTVELIMLAIPSVSGIADQERKV